MSTGALSCNDASVTLNFGPQQPASAEQFIVDLEIDNPKNPMFAVISADGATWAGLSGSACAASDLPTCKCVDVSAPDGTTVANHIPLTVRLNGGVDQAEVYAQLRTSCTKLPPVSATYILVSRQLANQSANTSSSNAAASGTTGTSGAGGANGSTTSAATTVTSTTATTATGGG